MKRYEFTVPGVPVSKQRPRVMRSGHTFTPQKTLNAENLIAFYARENGVEVLEGIVHLKIIAYFPIPQAKMKGKHKVNEGAFCPINKDWDNIGKTVSDALNHVAYHDDKQVVNASVIKRYSTEPRLEITLSELED